MTPTVFREGPFRFFFFSREGPKPHVHGSHLRWRGEVLGPARVASPLVSRSTTAEESSANSRVTQLVVADDRRAHHAGEQSEERSSQAVPDR
jgi:hypothetical protein